MNTEVCVNASFIYLFVLVKAESLCKFYYHLVISRVKDNKNALVSNREEDTSIAIVCIVACEEMPRVY